MTRFTEKYHTYRY